MANFKAGVKNGTVSGKSQWYPQVPGFKATFWGNGWGQNEEKASPGKMEKGGSKTGGKMMGSKHGKCPFC